jgi:ADP-heptose:LPS heptosyltransferase
MSLAGKPGFQPMAPELLSPNPDLPLREFDPGQAIAVVRDVGIGDIVMLAPSLKALKQKYPHRPLVFVTKPENFEVLAGASYLDAILPINAFRPDSFFKSFDLCLAVETIESGGKLTLDEYFAKTRPDVFAERLGVRPKGFALEPHEGAMSTMMGYFKQMKHPIIGLAPTCRSPLRVMPPEYVEPLVHKLAEYGGTVVLLGKTEGWNRHLAQIRAKGMTNFIDRLTIKDMIASIALTDVMIAPNTGTLHIAVSLLITTLALVGNNDPKTFVNIYPSAKALQPSKEELPCIPCGDQRRTCGLKQKQYGADCMQLLTPDRIYQALRSFYNGRNVALVRDISLEGNGGAEITDRALVKLGLDLGYNVRVFDNSKTAEELFRLFSYDLIILTNVWLFDKAKLDIVMKAISKVPYIKLEHDHRSLDEVVAGKFPKPLYAAPMFRNSVCNVFVSPAHREDYRLGLGTNGVCIFPPMDVDLYQPVPGVTRVPGSVLVVTPRKWGKQSLKAFMASHPGKVDLWGDDLVPPDKMPEVYSRYEFVAHLPQSKWSCERVIFEAALCGCKVITNTCAEGTSWGKDFEMPEMLRAWIKHNQAHFWDVIVDSFFSKKETMHEISRDRGDSLRRVSPGPVAHQQGA